MSHELYYAAVHADHAWGVELRRIFGKNAGDVRYTIQGEGTPGSTLRALYDARCVAEAAWRAVEVIK
jgi:hypothetical protein